MADYVALEDDGPPSVVSRSLLPPPSLHLPPSSSPSSSSPSLPSLPIPDDPSMVPHSSPPLHPHVLFSRLLSFSSRPACNRAIFFLYPAFLLLLSLSLLTIGVSERSPSAPSPTSQLSLWLIIAAVLLSLFSLLLLTLLLSLLSPSCAHGSALLLPLLLCLLLVHSALTFCWFIVGNVWFSLAPPSTSPRLVRTVFWVLIFVYGQLLLQPLVSVVDWSVKRGCQCIRRSEEGLREEEERRRAVNGWGAAADGQGGAQFI